MIISTSLYRKRNRLYGEIAFDLISGRYRQTFKEGWSVIGTTNHTDAGSMKLELIKVLFTERLPELFEMLSRTIKSGKIYPNPHPGKDSLVKELEPSWEIR